jgi:hypothetical protein
MKTSIPPVIITFALVCFAPLQNTQAVVPAPDGGYPGGNTAEGQNALLSLSTGAYNTGLGFSSLSATTIGNFNTGIGAGTLLANTADENTATGAGALLSNTIGEDNTANGAFALFSNTEGEGNTATGISALFSNTTGSLNTAIGRDALSDNTTGGFNTANGNNALVSNTTGSGNTANGEVALSNNTTGNSNTALGFAAGTGVTTANNVICIGTLGVNVSDSCYIGNIFGQPVAIFGAAPVLVDSDGKLGTVLSSRRFKHDIKPMDKASETLLVLKPVTFHYKSDSKDTPQFGLIAEEVAEVNPDLVVRDKEGKPYTVRYDQVNAMLLNEFLKEHRKNEQQEATIIHLKQDFQSKLAEQQKQIEALTNGLQKVSAQLELSKPAAQTVNNNQ